MIQILGALVLLVVGLYLFQAESELIDVIDDKTGKRYQDVESTPTGTLGWIMALFAVLYLAAKLLIWIL